VEKSFGLKIVIFFEEDKIVCPFGSNQYTNAPHTTPTKDTMHLISFVFLALTAVTAAVGQYPNAAEGQYYPCVTTNAANGNCTALTDANINNAVNDTINNPSYALAEWGDISDW